ncbi:GntR family transcriptional regulator [Streptomyces fragilis]|uniref:GntR family transcriptional regulator n=1 Tax=Streptomyces fragilis TaxID=67301 RepID=A0ABV2YRS0_9ACTN|nr:GntR family transcriptional regulator [Streptomyces fragilis]
MGTTGVPGPVTRSTLRQQIAEALRDEVLAGRLHPGQEFTVKEIAEQYGVSATPVREALVDLSAQELLEAVQHRGFRVRAFSVEDFRYIVQARALISDGMFLRLAARSGSDGPGFPDTAETASLVAVRRRGEECQRAAHSGELSVLIGYDLRYWRELSGLFGNPYLTDFLHRLRVQAWVCTVQHLRRLADLRAHMWAGHTALVDALVRGDAAESQRLVAESNTFSLDLVERLTASYSADGSRNPGRGQGG